MSAALVAPARSLRIGWLVNPFAGVGGAQGNKGSDDAAIQALAAAGEIPLRAPVRAQQFLAALSELIDPAPLVFVCPPGAMGAQHLDAAGLSYELLDVALVQPSSAADTDKALTALVEAKPDLLVFVGGDGTARDVCRNLGESLPVLGIPSGVKMHSGVFAITPEGGAQVLADLVAGKLTALLRQEVRDIDEQAFREGVVRSRHYGEMLVPAENQYVQHVKQGGMEVEELVLMDIAAQLRERLEDQTTSPVCVVFAPGSTTRFIQQEFGLESTLLGVDVFALDENLGVIEQKLDVNSRDLEQFSAHYDNVKIVLTAIGGQGHIIGRGNQQLSPALLRRVGKSSLWLVATKTKLESLASRPLIIDSADADLDRAWSGFIPVTCGYRDTVLYRVGIGGERLDEIQRLTAHLAPTLDDVLAAGQSRRLFHGRGGTLPGLEWCCIDYFAPVIFITLFKEPPPMFLAQLVDYFADLSRERSVAQPLSSLPDQTRSLAIVAQHRYSKPVDNQVLLGEIPTYWLAQCGELRFQLEAQHQNIGFFLDAAPVRDWLLANARGKRVLNLFAYTCALSVVACAGGAESVVNIDMARKALAVGRHNHKLNETQFAHLPRSAVQYLPHNILNSWGKLKKMGPYDIVIADPPSYQKGSFVLSADYPKVLRRMGDLVAPGGVLIACANAPELPLAAFKEMVENHCPVFECIEQLVNSTDFPDVDPDRALKMLIFRRTVE